MSYTKYAMTASGKFVMISKYSGLDHLQLSLLLPEEPVSAGFVIEMDGKLCAYGQSISLGLRSNESDGEVISETLEGGSLKIKWDELCDSYFAGNVDHFHMLPDMVSMETLVEKRIMER